MVTLITCLSTGKGSWLKVMEILDAKGWDNIVVITTSFGREKFKTDKDVEFIIIDDDQDARKIKEIIVAGLKGHASDFEVALNIDSGSGKEHMAIISAIMQLGMSLRFVTAEDGELIEITPYDS